MTGSVAGDDVGGLAGEVVALLRERGETLSTAESLTGGLVSAALTSVPGSSAVYVGGLVTYATDLKVRLLGVPEQLVRTHGVISAECAEAMAAGAASRTGSHWALATTGVAGPDLQEGHPAGTVFTGLCRPDGSTTSQALTLVGDRQLVRSATVEAALRLARAVLLSANSSS